MLRIHFIVRKPQGATGKYKVYCRITVDGQRATAFATGVTADAREDIDTTKDYVRKDPAGTELLRSMRAQITRLHTAQQEAGRPITAASLQALYLGSGKPVPTLLELLVQEVAEASVSVRRSTVSTYTSQISSIRAWLRDSRQEGMLLSELTAQHLQALVRYYVQKGRAHNYAVLLCTMLTRVAAGKYREAGMAYPPVRWADIPRRQRQERGSWLTEQELAQLSGHSFEGRLLQKAQHLFTLACWTGLSHTDLCALDLEHVQQVDGLLVIVQPRRKTGERSVVPLSEQAAQVLAAYGGQAPRIHLDQYNRLLKEIGALVLGGKAISSHTARRTFGMLMLNRGVPLEVVSRMLGHKSVQVTQKYYAEVLEGRVVRDTLRALDGTPVRLAAASSGVSVAAAAAALPGRVG